MADNRSWGMEERIIKTDFIDKIKKMQVAKSMEDEEKQFEARVEAEVQRRMNEFFAQQTTAGRFAQLNVDEQNAVAALMMNKSVGPQMSTEVTTEASKTTDITPSEAAVESSKPTDSTPDATAETSKTTDDTPLEVDAGGSTNT